MSEQIPTNPTPTAVPWSPEMMTAETSGPVASSIPGAAPAQHFAPSQPPGHAAQYQAAPNEYTPPAEPQTAQPYAPQALTQPHMQSGQFAPSPQPQQTQSPQYAQVPAAPAHHMQLSAAPQMLRAAAAVPPHHGAQPQYAQPGPPPLPLQIQPGASGHPSLDHQAAQAPEKSKSFIANLLKRSPKPAQVVTDMQAPAKSSGSLFNKNFALGAVTGLVIGAFIVPMVLDMLVGDSAPAQAQAQAAPLTKFEPAPAADDSGLSIDNVITKDAP